MVSSGRLPVQNIFIDWTALRGVIASEESVTNAQGLAEGKIVQKYDLLRLKTVATKSGYDTKEVPKNIQFTQDVESAELSYRLLGRELKLFQVLISLAIIIALALGGYVYTKYRRSREDEPEDLKIYS